MVNEGNRKTRIIYMPIYKSYTDMFLLTFIQFHQNLELGFTFGNYEDTPQWDYINRFIKRLGLIQIKRDPRNSVSSNNNQYTPQEQDVIDYVNQSLFQEVLQNNQSLTIFQNDERIRSGKFNLPLYAETSVQLLLKTY